MKQLGRMGLLGLVTCLLADAALAERKALLIGNDLYEHARKLEKAASDARSFGNVLAGMGFADPLVRENLKRTAMNTAVGKFVAGLKPEDEVIFYFAGHGGDKEGKNYLLPIDFPAPGEIEFESRLDDEGVRLGGLLEKIREKKPRFVLAIVDACRDNPFPQLGARGGEEVGRLADESPPRGMLLVYAAEPGKKALDYLRDKNEDPNGVFMRALLPLLRTPGVEIHEVLRQVRGKVKELTRERQFPNWHDLFDGRFCFQGPCESDRHLEVGRLDEAQRKLRTEQEATEQLRQAAREVEKSVREVKESLDRELKAAQARATEEELQRKRAEREALERKMEEARRKEQEAAESLRKLQGAESTAVPPYAKTEILQMRSGDEGARLFHPSDFVNPDKSPACWDKPGKKANECIDSRTGMEFVWVPGGTFRMGAPEDRSGPEVALKG
ncbi:MAG: caspase family protein, partial [Magnetococcales bacterium]|nr:caspase family protein [Magnetococcales bacterium]